MNVRQVLREATEADHERVDALFGGLDLADPAGYRAFLLAQAAAFLPVEAALDLGGAAALISDWDERRRSEALKRDLAALGLAEPEPVLAPVFPSPAAVLGGVYVLEGSRLGGALLSRSVPSRMPRSFLESRVDSGRWRKLLEDLERLIYRPEQVAVAVQAARQVFACFATAGERQLESARA